jgi:hypothetical protein
MTLSTSLSSFAESRQTAAEAGHFLMADFYAETMADIEMMGLLKQAGF